MATTKQKKLAKEIVKNLSIDKPATAGQMLEKVGYATSVAEHKPAEILESKGVQEELAALGFSIEEADRTIAKLLKSEKEEIQIKASQEIYKRLSGYAPEKKINLNVSHSDSSLDALIEKIEYELDSGT